MYNMSDVEEGRWHKLYDTWQVADSIVIWQCKIITQGYQEVHGSCSGVRKGVWEYLSKLIFFFICLPKMWILLQKTIERTLYIIFFKCLKWLTHVKFCLNNYFYKEEQLERERFIYNIESFRWKFYHIATFGLDNVSIVLCHHRWEVKDLWKWCEKVRDVWRNVWGNHGWLAYRWP